MFRVFAAGLCLLAVANAQETIHLASIIGRVTDPSDALVTGAAVTTRQLETKMTSSSVTDREGQFRFAYLKVGQYQLTVRQEQGLRRPDQG